MYRKFLLILVICLTTGSVSYSQVNRKIDSIQNLLAKEEIDTLRVKHLYKLCWEYLTLDPAKAKEYGLKALDLAVKIDFKRGIAASLNNIGNIYYYSDDYSKAIEYYTKSFRVRERINDKKGMSDNLNNIGVIYQSRGIYSKALDFFIRSLKIDEELKDLEGMAACYNNIGLIMSNMKNFPKALEYYNKSIETYADLDNDYGTASSLNNKGLLLSNFNKTDSALLVFRQALEIYEKNNDKFGSAVCYNNLASVYKEKGDPGLEKMFVQRALELRKEIGDKEGYASSLIALGRIENTEQNYPKALIHVVEGLNLARNIGNIETMSSGYNLASEIFGNTGDYKTAFEYHKKYSFLKDSLISEESIKSISDLQIKYESEKQQQAIDILTKNNKIQQLENSRKAEEISKQRIMIYGFIIGLLIIAAFSFFLYKALSEKQKTNHKLESAYEQIAEKNRDITDSINYAKRIQRSLLTSGAYLKKNLPEHFVLYKPKDIVSGDFYWAYKLNDGRTFVATIDCTGHGVPGAFMSFIANAKISELIIEKKLEDPADILDHLREEIIKATNPEDAEEESLDGMDITLCLYDLAKKKLTFAAANHSLYQVRNSELTIYKGDKMPVGKHIGIVKPFSSQIVDIEKGDMIYSLTDGYSDQTGGQNGKKFKYKALQEYLVSISSDPSDLQKEKLEMNFDDWRGEELQVDDVCIIGVRI